MVCEKHGEGVHPSACAICLHEEITRLKHVITVLKSSISITYHTAENVEANIRISGAGRLQAWCLGEWVDVENENAEVEEDK